MKKPEPIKIRYIKAVMKYGPAIMIFDSPLSLEQIEKITNYLAGKSHIARNPIRRD